MQYIKVYSCTNTYQNTIHVTLTVHCSSIYCAVEYPLTLGDGKGQEYMYYMEIGVHVVCIRVYWWGRLVLPACPHIITRTFQEGLKRKGVGLDVGRWELW